MEAKDIKERGSDRNGKSKGKLKSRFSLLVSLLLATWPSLLGIVAIISCVDSINSQSSHLVEDY